MKRPVSALLLSAVIGMAAAGEPEPACSERQPAQEHATAFLAQVDAGLYEAAWDSGTSYYRAEHKRDVWLKLAREVLAPAGKPQTRELLAFSHAQATEPHAAARLAVFDYAVISADGSRHSEEIAVGALPAGECGVVHYQVDARRMVLTRLLDAFVANVNWTGGRLDYSDASLIEIERVLMEHAPGGTPRAKQTKGADYRSAIHFFGQYVGEVLIRRHGGSWSHTPRPDYPVPPLVLMPQGQRIDPYQLVADYSRQPAIGTLRQAYDRELTVPAPQP